MNKQSISFGIIGLIAGLIIGFAVANSINRNAVQTTQNTQQVPNLPVNNPQAQGKPPQQGGMLADVQKTIDKATNNPEDFQAQVEAGRMYAQIQRFDKALAFFQKAQQLKPNDFQANALLGNAYFDDRQFENAEKAYAKALELKTDVTVQSDYATTFFQRTNPDYERAIKEFEKALKIDEKHEPTLYNMALAYLKMDDKENAQKTFERLKSVNPNSLLIQRFEQILNSNNLGK